MKLPSATSTGRLRALMVGALALACVALATPAARAANLSRGFVDDVWFDPPAHGISQRAWLVKTKATGARIAQVQVDWSELEPRRPSHGQDPSSPSSRWFNFAGLDQEVQVLARGGLEPVILVTDAPRWAQGRGGTRGEYASGGYKPDARALRGLAEALAKRYSGHYRPPLPKPKAKRHKGKKHTPVKPRKSPLLPRVRYLQAWAEANMNLHLSPQWTRIHGHVVNTGAQIYRTMLNEFYAGVKAGDRSDVVLASGLESYGDAPFAYFDRTHPVVFLRNLLCLTAKDTRARCGGASAHFDVLASDPYDSFAPDVHAISPLDASAPDLGRLTRVVRAALAAHTLLPDRHKPLWVTEFGYDSNPPNHSAPSPLTQARWLEESFYVFAHEGVSTVLWYLVRDQPPPYTVNYASGVYFRTGRPKPSCRAYRFPFVVMPSAQAAQAWGIAPAGGTVRVQVRVAGGWRTIRTFRRREGASFQFTSSTLGRGSYRAVAADGLRSLVWHY